MRGSRKLRKVELRLVVANAGRGGDLGGFMLDDLAELGDALGRQRRLGPLEHLLIGRPVGDEQHHPSLLIGVGVWTGGHGGCGSGSRSRAGASFTAASPGRAGSAKRAARRRHGAGGWRPAPGPGRSRCGPRCAWAPPARRPPPALSSVLLTGRSGMLTKAWATGLSTVWDWGVSVR